MTSGSSTTTATAHLALLTFFSLSSFFFLWRSRRLRLPRLSSPSPVNPNPKPNPPNRKAKLFFASQTGTSQSLARRLAALLSSHSLPFDLVDPESYEPEDLPKETLVLIVASTWEDGKPPPNARFLAQWLAESAEDFRVGSLLLSKCRFAVFGVGSRSYEQTFNAAARDFSKWMRALGAVEAVPVCDGDVDGGDLDAVFDSWSGKVVKVLRGDVGEREVDLVPGVESDGFYESEEEEGSESEAVDMEDIAGKAPLRKSSVALANGKPSEGVENGRNGLRDMVTPIIRTSLEKQVMVFC